MRVPVIHKNEDTYKIHPEGEFECKSVEWTTDDLRRSVSGTLWFLRGEAFTEHGKLYVHMAGLPFTLEFIRNARYDTTEPFKVKVRHRMYQGHLYAEAEFTWQY